MIAGTRALTSCSFLNRFSRHSKPIRSHPRLVKHFSDVAQPEHSIMTRKYDYDYNYDPEGTSEVKQDPYTDDYLAGSRDEEPKPEAQPPYHAPRSPNYWNPPPPRSRSPTPLKKTEPSAEYLSISQEPSTQLTDCKTQRKLLILDLNGTLVLRSPHTRRNAYQLQGASRPLRAVFRRPYLLTFVDYLFDPRTREWLDTMVWSSAQPHSVDDMVKHCFEGRKEELVAIWARDTLGLSQAAYSAIYLGLYGGVGVF